jgi:hypothetical protein
MAKIQFYQSPCWMVTHANIHGNEIVANKCNRSYLCHNISTIEGNTNTQYFPKIGMSRQGDSCSVVVVVGTGRRGIDIRFHRRWWQQMG